MTMEPVESSNIAEVGHEPATNEMDVKFKSGHTYTLSNVSADQHAAFMASPSKGKHFHATFKGKHQHRKHQQ